MKPSAELVRLQAAFGRSIATPLQFLDDDGNYALQVDRYDEVAIRAISPRAAQTAADRLGIYNQQYWFRLLTVMQEEFPLTEALMGVQAFNRFSMAYLDACPPDSVRLRDLSNRLPRFAVAHGLSETLQESIRLERIYIEAFDAASLPVPDSDDLAVAVRLATEPLRFQPHVTLFEATHNVISLRAKVRAKTVVTAADLEQAPGSWIFWRGAGTQAVELGAIQALLMRKLLAGVPLAEACETLVETLDDEQVEFFATHVQRWFAAWATAGWFARPADL